MKTLPATPKDVSSCGSLLMWRKSIAVWALLCVGVAFTPSHAGTVVGWGSQCLPLVPPGTRLTDIAAGGWHSLALKSDGTVVGWGLNGYGQASPPPGLSNAVAVAAGGWHSLALKSDGTVVGWGLNGYGQASPSPGLSNAVAIAARYYHSLALKSDGTVVGWGANSDGQATPPEGLSNVVATAAGGDHSLALKNDGTVVGWGWNNYGQATPPPGLRNVVAIAAGEDRSLALVAFGPSPFKIWRIDRTGTEPNPTIAIQWYSDPRMTYTILRSTNGVFGPYHPIATGQTAPFNVYTESIQPEQNSAYYRVGIAY